MSAVLTATRPIEQENVVLLVNFHDGDGPRPFGPYTLSEAVRVRERITVHRGKQPLTIHTKVLKKAEKSS